MAPPNLAKNTTEVYFEEPTIAPRPRKISESSPEDKKNVAVWDRPSWPQEGWLRHEEKSL
jgi:hypothetical protein